eukprot:Pgem_evm1s18535
MAIAELLVIERISDLHVRSSVIGLPQFVPFSLNRPTMCCIWLSASWVSSWAYFGVMWVVKSCFICEECCVHFRFISSTMSGKSLMNRVTRIGRNNIDPCGTPDAVVSKGYIK